MPVAQYRCHGTGDGENAREHGNAEPEDVIASGFHRLSIQPSPSTTREQARPAPTDILPWLQAAAQRDLLVAGDRRTGSAFVCKSGTGRLALRRPDV
jgi:hypothetical protein